MWPNSGNILKVELIGFANRFYVGGEREREVNDGLWSLV